MNKIIESIYAKCGVDLNEAFSKAFADGIELIRTHGVEPTYEVYNIEWIKSDLDDIELPQTVVIPRYVIEDCFGCGSEPEGYFSDTPIATWLADEYGCEVDLYDTRIKD